jgi:hypothetical protein
MTHLGLAGARSALASFLVLGVISAATLAGDCSKYRNFQLGADLQTVVNQLGASPSRVKVIHRRPALIQELEWRPQPLGPSSQTESANEVVFNFYNGELFRIVVSYDRSGTDGLTADDFIEAISATYGIVEMLTPPANAVVGQYGDPEEILARWQDPQYCFDLIRSTYGPSFRLIGVLKRLQVPVQAAIAEAKQLDDREAPQRDAARKADEREIERARLEKSRLVNKPKFRP